jgi:hypothetical protein
MRGDCPLHTSPSIFLFIIHIPLLADPDTWLPSIICTLKFMEVNNSKGPRISMGMASPTVVGLGQRGSQHDDLEPDKMITRDSRSSQQRNPLPQIFEISLPFAPRPCTAFQERGTGHYTLLNVNNAVLHSKSQHSGERILFSCSQCKKEFPSKHAVQWHVPKRPGLASPQDSDIRCEELNRIFLTKRGLSQHEKTAHLYSEIQRG